MRLVAASCANPTHAAGLWLTLTQSRPKKCAVAPTPREGAKERTDVAVHDALFVAVREGPGMREGERDVNGLRTQPDLRTSGPAPPARTRGRNARATLESPQEDPLVARDGRPELPGLRQRAIEGGARVRRDLVRVPVARAKDAHANGHAMPLSWAAHGGTP